MNELDHAMRRLAAAGRGELPARLDVRARVQASVAGLEPSQRFDDLYVCGLGAVAAAGAAIALAPEALTLLEPWVVYLFL